MFFFFNIKEAIWHPDCNGKYGHSITNYAYAYLQYWEWRGAYKFLYLSWPTGDKWFLRRVWEVYRWLETNKFPSESDTTQWPQWLTTCADLDPNSPETSACD